MTWGRLRRSCPTSAMLMCRPKDALAASMGISTQQRSPPGSQDLQDVLPRIYDAQIVVPSLETAQ